MVGVGGFASGTELYSTIPSDLLLGMDLSGNFSRKFEGRKKTIVHLVKEISKYR